MADILKENMPVSRLPRLASPAPKAATISSLTASTTAGIKRKATAATSFAPVAKRSGLQASTRTNTMSTSAAASTSTLTRPKSTLGQSVQRRVPSGGCISSAGSSTGASRRPTGISATRRSTPPGKMPLISTAAKRATAARIVSTGIGSGMASAAQLQNQSSRMANVEKSLGGLQSLLQLEQQKISTLQTSQVDLQTLLASTQTHEREARRDLSSASEELQSLRSAHSREVDDLERQIQRKEREKKGLEDDLRDLREDLTRERETLRELKTTLAQSSTAQLTLTAQLSEQTALNSMLQSQLERAHLTALTNAAELEKAQAMAALSCKSADERVAEVQQRADARVAEVESELRTAETVRRKLHNQVQELKGNIRVFARVRPALAHEAPDLADISYGDERTALETGQSSIVLRSTTESATGQAREQLASFIFDKVFEPKASQRDVFEEIEMLAQSVLDGYNVCIFAYGQTGSGKSWTMEGGAAPETQGMIPRAIDMIFRVSSGLKDRGWSYSMEGSFLEVYNEVINDLLGFGAFDSKKHEIKLDKDGKVSVTEIVSLPLKTPSQVSTLLERASSRRAVAATLMNERSSRSHSVFMLKVRGVNPLTGEKCEGILNLVDLAGSERLASSGAGENKDRMKETININKSLSALADVIGALGNQSQGNGHVPYRNSTLTKLLQTSLSGQSKTLMLCNLSPMAAHLGESLCSLRFATKVNSTVVGSVKKSGAK